VPELPEVETMRRGILAIERAKISSACIVPCICRPISIVPKISVLNKQVQGTRIDKVDRLGKRVVLRLSSQDCLIFEPRMTGLVLLTDPPDVDHLRFRLDLATGSVKSIWFWDRRGLGSIRLLNPAQMNEQLGANRLGPDALAVTATQLAQQFEKSRRPIKVALLDQQLLAGVGNLYASEILHWAKINPTRLCTEISQKQWQAIHLHLLRVLEEAIAHEGSTLSDGTYRNALNQQGDYQNCHVVYDREGECCLTCHKGIIERMVQAQRSTFFCPKCQK
jgi:formamidopyrimidine-DNA glycosylase